MCRCFGTRDVFAFRLRGLVSSRTFITCERSWTSVRAALQGQERRAGMFTPIETSIGAILLHQATSNLLYQNGNVLGASGLLRQLFTAPTKETIAFFAGMAASYLPLKVLAPHLITKYPTVSMTLQTALLTMSIGALIGLGTKVSRRRQPRTRSSRRLNERRCQMAAHPDTCFAAFPVKVDGH